MDLLRRVPARRARAARTRSPRRAARVPGRGASARHAAPPLHDCRSRRRSRRRFDRNRANRPTLPHATDAPSKRALMRIDLDPSRCRRSIRPPSCSGRANRGSRGRRGPGRTLAGAERCGARKPAASGCARAEGRAETDDDAAAAKTSEREPIALSSHHLFCRRENRSTASRGPPACLVAPVRVGADVGQLQVVGAVVNDAAGRVDVYSHRRARYNASRVVRAVRRGSARACGPPRGRGRTSRTASPAAA